MHVQVRHSCQGDGASIVPHFDCDEQLQHAGGLHVPPWLSTVTYLSPNGAPTLLLPVVADARGRARLPADGMDAALLSFPLRGKHLAFDGRLLHGCPRQLARCSPGSEDYTRVTFLGAPAAASPYDRPWYSGARWSEASARWPHSLSSLPLPTWPHTPCRPPLFPNDRSAPSKSKVPLLICPSH